MCYACISFQVHVHDVIDHTSIDAFNKPRCTLYNVRYLTL